MALRRLRPAHPPERLAQIYAKPHDSSHWRDHVVRVAITCELAANVFEDCTVCSVADLSCGDATVARYVEAARTVLGDIAPGYHHTGPIEQTIDEIDPVDLFICCETIEHLDDPHLILKKIRAKTRYLVLSTPIDAWDDANIEHYWAWDRDEVEWMLYMAGFTTLKPYVQLDMRESWSPYCFGIWVAS